MKNLGEREPMTTLTSPYRQGNYLIVAMAHLVGCLLCAYHWVKLFTHIITMGICNYSMTHIRKTRIVSSERLGKMPESLLWVRTGMRISPVFHLVSIWLLLIIPEVLYTAIFLTCHSSIPGSSPSPRIGHHTHGPLMLGAILLIPNSC
jgi:hypothetical protein